MREAQRRSNPATLGFGFYLTHMLCQDRKATGLLHRYALRNDGLLLPGQAVLIIQQRRIIERGSISRYMSDKTLIKE